jgi:hypothetical protein
MKQIKAAFISKKDICILFTYHAPMPREPTVPSIYVQEKATIWFWLQKRLTVSMFPDFFSANNASVLRTNCCWCNLFSGLKLVLNMTCNNLGILYLPRGCNRSSLTRYFNRSLTMTDTFLPKPRTAWKYTNKSDICFFLIVRKVNIMFKQIIDLITNIIDKAVLTWHY